jgi:NAD+ diphosphatase
MFIYCPKCKNNINKNNEHYFCKSCGFDYYNTPNPAVIVIIINSDNKIYLCKRAYEPKKGKLSLPGGFIDFKESAEEAAKREIKEELGIDINNLQYLCSYSNDYLYKGTQYYPLDIVFISKVSLEEIKPIQKEEIFDGQFYNINNLPLDDFGFNSHKKAVKFFLKLEN